MMEFQETIELKRITLRWLRQDDAKVFFESYTQDREVAKFLRWTVHETLDETMNFINERIVMRENNAGCYWVLTLKNEDRPIGMIGARLKEKEINLGYGLSRGYWGKGFMTEAVAGVVNWAWQQEEVDIITASCDRENMSSARVLEKAGFRKDESRTTFSIRPNISEAPRPKDFYISSRKNGIHDQGK